MPDSSLLSLSLSKGRGGYYIWLSRSPPVTSFFHVPVVYINLPSCLILALLLGLHLAALDSSLLIEVRQCAIFGDIYAFIVIWRRHGTDENGKNFGGVPSNGENSSVARFETQQGKWGKRRRRSLSESNKKERAKRAEQSGVNPTAEQEPQETRMRCCYYGAVDWADFHARDVR